MIGRSAQPMIDWIKRRESYRAYVWQRIQAECDSIDGRLLQRISRSSWAGKGATRAERIRDFITKAHSMLDYLGIEVHRGGDVIATMAVMLAAMDELEDLPIVASSAKCSQLNSKLQSTPACQLPINPAICS